MSKLTLADIADSRAYEREREDFRRQVIALKRIRRVGVGPIVTFVFENRATMRFQVQEMARAEKMVTDEQIQIELDVYNELIPEPGEISATMFIELTSEADLRRWLSRLVGIERAVELRLADGSVVGAEVEEGHASQLTREETTASVHYVRFRLSEAEASVFSAGDVQLAVQHPEYAYSAGLDTATIDSVVADWGQFPT